LEAVSCDKSVWICPLIKYKAWGGIRCLSAGEVLLEIPCQFGRNSVTTINWPKLVFCNIFCIWESFSRTARKALASRMMCKPAVKCTKRINQCLTWINRENVLGEARQRTRKNLLSKTRCTHAKVEVEIRPQKQMTSNDSASLKESKAVQILNSFQKIWSLFCTNKIRIYWQIANVSRQVTMTFTQSHWGLEATIWYSCDLIALRSWLFVAHSQALGQVISLKFCVRDVFFASSRVSSHAL